MKSKVLLPLLLVAATMGSAAIPDTAVAAAGLDVVTECTPFHPYPGVTHQKCTQYRYGADGQLLSTFVYYIDENGVWYVLP